MPKRTNKPVEQVCELEIRLLEIEPPIRRRFAVPYNISLWGLHRVIQVVMGWWDRHLHQFIIQGEYYGTPDPEGDLDEDMRDETQVGLHHVVKRTRAKFIYEYDFGDGWEHELTVVKIGPPASGTHYLICLEGQRNCPPEDCGGAWGYQELLDIIADPKHEEHKNMMEWLGDGFDPEQFDLAGVNKRLKEFR